MYIPATQHNNGGYAMTRLEEMIVTIFPTARPGIDFDFIFDENQHAELSKWDVLRLGERPELAKLRKHFLTYIERKSKLIPTIDQTDPAPWLDDSFEEFEPASAASAAETHPEIKAAETSSERYLMTANRTLLRYK